MRPMRPCVRDASGEFNWTERSNPRASRRTLARVSESVAPAKVPHHKGGKRGGALSVRKFVRALSHGATLGEAAKAAGSRATTSKALRAIGCKFRQSERVRAALAKVDGLLEEQWTDFLRWGALVQKGIVKVTDQDRIKLGVAAGQAAGKFIDRKELHVTHGTIVCRDLTAGAPRVIDATPVSPALPPGAPPALEASCEARVVEPVPIPEGEGKP